jgi:predicted benzoate:H+ symporter BenE
VATTVLSLVYRQPIAFAVPSVGLIFVKSLADALSFEEILGATMIAGVVVMVLALSGVSTSLDFRPYAVACRVSVQEEAGFRATGVGHGGSEK